jgi:glycosyltransferase 2 family protein
MSKGQKILVDGLKTIFFLGIGILLIWLVVRNLTEKDKTEIFHSFSQANYGVILLIMLLGIFSHVSRAIRWQIMIEPLGHKPGFLNTLMAVLVGYLANLAVPRIGEITRCGVLKRYEKLPLDSVFGTVVVERIMDTILLMIVSVITIVWQFDVLSAKLEEAYNTYVGPAKNPDAFPIKTIIIISFFTVLTALFLLRKSILKTKLAIKLIAVLKGFSVGLKTITKLKKPYLFVFHSILIWVIYFLGIYVGFKALPETNALGIGASFAILFFGTFAFILVQGGIGAYQIIVQNTLVIYGISANLGYALGWIIWSSQTIAIILGGLLSLILLPILNKNKHGLSTGHTK